MKQSSRNYTSFPFLFLPLMRNIFELELVKLGANRHNLVATESSFILNVSRDTIKTLYKPK